MLRTIRGPQAAPRQRQVWGGLATTAWVRRQPITGLDNRGCPATTFTGEGSMNKKDLIDQVAEKSGLNKTQAAASVSAMIDVIAQEMAAGRQVNIHGFGQFVTKKSRGRTGTNPRTGKPLEIKARARVTFKPGAALRDAVN